MTRSQFWSLRFPLASFAALALALLLVASTSAAPVASYEFATPLFGLAATPSGSLLVADTGAGIVELKNGQGTLIAELPGVADVASLGGPRVLALTGGGEGDTAASLFYVTRGKVRPIANLAAFESEVNPDGSVVESNPFDLAALRGGSALVADAAGNSLVSVDKRGNLDWVATFPVSLESTANLKQLAGCPNPSPELAFACGLPDALPTESVPTSVAVGPDGAYYVGELRGFPAPSGASRIWRVEPGARHADCGVSPACSVVAEGFTSIIDLTFGLDGTLYVVEFDEASWFAVETGQAIGGTVNRCAPDAGGFSCTSAAEGLFLPTAAAVALDGTVYATVAALVPGQAQVIEIP